MIQAIQDALPRARGGISRAGGEILRVNASSPRTRGYFQRHYYTDRPMNLFPAHAGVFPALAGLSVQWGPLPRARGGISASGGETFAVIVSSPRTRGYFQASGTHSRNTQLFPAHAGVFPCECDRHFCRPPLPRARGGISQIRIGDEPWETSSPRTRGYFRCHGAAANTQALFPAHAGVFPLTPARRTVWLPLPRARGGISTTKREALSSCISSPRTRGYFLPGFVYAKNRELFPAHAGVFPSA